MSMNEILINYETILAEYLKYYAKISIYHPKEIEQPTYDKTYGTAHIIETIHKDDIKIRIIDFTDTAGHSFSFIIGTALLLFSSRYAKYRDELIDTYNIKGVISLKRGLISEKMNPSAIIVIDRICKPKNVWFSSASTVNELLGLIIKEKSERHKIYYSDTIDKSNLSPEHYNLDKFSITEGGKESVSVKELQDLAEIIRGKVIPSKNLKKSGGS